MATLTFSDITAALSQTYTRRLADQLNRRADVLQYIRVVQNDTGKNIAWDAKFAGSKATTVFAEGADVDASEYGFNVEVPATLNYGNYRAPTKVTDSALFLSRDAVGSPEELMDLLNEKVSDSLKTLTDSIGVDIYSGTGTSGGNPNIVGLYGLAALSTGTYAGINRATYAPWAGNVLGNGGVARPLTDDLLRQAEALIFTASGRTPNLILTSAGVHRKYGGLFSSIQRVQTPGQAPAQLGMGTMDLFWGNMPIVRDKSHPTGKLIMLNTEDLEMVVPRTLLAATGQLRPAQAAETSLTDVDGRRFQIPVIVEPLARAGNSLPVNVWTHVQLRLRHPNRTAIINDISES